METTLGLVTLLWMFLFMLLVERLEVKLCWMIQVECDSGAAVPTWGGQEVRRVPGVLGMLKQTIPTSKFLMEDSLSC